MKQKKKSPRTVALKTVKSLLKTLPVMAGVVLLIGLLKTFISFETLSGYFSGNPLGDTILGALSGSVLAGNAMNSYIIAREMVQSGIGALAATAFLVTWVTVGFVQIPAEREILGGRFTLVRNALSVVLSIFVAFATIWMTGGMQ